jgi:hypothetical protein
VADIENFLKGKSETPPLDPHECRLGAWLNDEGTARYGMQPIFHVIHQLHQQVHALSLSLLELHNNGKNLEALARLGELHALRDDLLEKLKGVALVPQPV